MIYSEKMNNKKQADVVSAYYMEKQLAYKYRRKDSFVEYTSISRYYDTFYGLSRKEIEIMVEWN